jgi:hypothetical protein
MSIADIDPEVRGGISWLWGLPLDHPFQPCFAKHDAYYSQLIAGTLKKTSLEIDSELLYDMLVIAHDPKWSWERRVELIAEAHLFYRCARTWATTVRAPMWKEFGPKIEKGPYAESGEHHGEAE